MQTGLIQLQYHKRNFTLLHLLSPLSIFLTTHIHSAIIRSNRPLDAIIMFSGKSPAKIALGSCSISATQGGVQSVKLRL